MFFGKFTGYVHIKFSFQDENLQLNKKVNVVFMESLKSYIKHLYDYFFFWQKQNQNKH